MKILKDLVYGKDNKHLDIARVSAFLSVISFWGGVFYSVYQGNEFDPLNVGTGCAAIFAGAAGWIYYRQKHESEDSA